LMRYCLILLLAIAGNCWAVDAKIGGPAEAIVGDLVVLTSSESVGDNKLWIIDPAADGRTIECNETLAFAIGTPGRYEFTLVVADKEAQIAYARHSVTIRQAGPVPTPDPIPDPKPDDPKPQPPSGVEQFEKLSKEQAAKLNDVATAVRLQKSLLDASASVRGRSLDEAKRAIGSAFEATMLQRTGASRDKDWLSTWRVPINEAIAAWKPKDTAAYLAAIEATAKGLVASAASDTVETKVTLYTRKGCVYCDRWKANVMPALEAAGWKIEIIDGAGGSVPRFDVCAYGKCTNHTGYMDVATFGKIVQSMK
jgi:hypothetical protein